MGSMGYGAALSAVGGLFSFAGNVMKKKVTVPIFNEVNAQAQQEKAIEGNLSALPEASRLASGVNEFNQAELLKQLRNAIPNYDQLQQRGSDIVTEFSAPGVPKDIQDLIQRKSSAKALGGGYGGSQSHTNLELRDLGLTGLELAGKKLNAIESWLGFAKQNAMAPMMDVTSMFITPQQQISLAVSERDKRFNRDFAASVLKAQQHWRTYMGNEFVEFGGTLKGVGAGMMGGGMGGGGAAGGGSSMMMGAGGGGGASAASASSAMPVSYNAMLG